MSTPNSLENHVKKCIELLLNDIKIVHQNVKKDISFVSNIINVIVNGKNISGEDVKLNLFIKTPKSEKCREYMSIDEKYARELYVYKYIFPQFTNLQEKRRILNQFEAYPKYYISSDEDQKEVIILENLLEKGFEMCDINMTLDYNHALLVIKQIGRFHALSFATRNQLPLIFKEMFNNSKDIEIHGEHAQLSKHLGRAIFPMVMNAFKSANPTSEYKKLNQVKDTFPEIVQQAVQNETAEPYSVLNHGDLWITNMLFKYDTKNHPIDVCLVDFQLSRMCSPVSDISQLIYTCLNKETRQKHYNDLIDEYYKSFSSFLRELGSDPEKLFPYEVLQDHLRKFSIIGLWLAIRIISLKTVSSEKMPKFDKISVGTAANEILINGIEENTFNEYIRDVILDYLRFGYEFKAHDA